ncbi:MAG: transcription termination/antitermination protein NusA, partial [Mucispirillum sp.]|nr:transcription termination/antitermination protein NusA [Mucispirillum sp.]
MSVSREIMKNAEELGREKGVSREVLTEALREAMTAAAVKRIGRYLEPEVDVDLDKGVINILIPKEVSESPETNLYEITVEDAKEYKENPQYGDILMVPITFEALGRQSALVAKQKLIEKLKEAEKQVILDDFQNKIGEIVNGTILKTDRDNVIVSIGKTEAVLPKREMIPGDFFNRNDYVRALLLDIRIIKGWPQLVLSRT